MDSTATFEPEVAVDPIALFRHWFDEASASEPNDPNAVALATATTDGHPSLRMVLMKRLDDRGFAFYTNAESRKGVELLENRHAALLFHWKSRRRQVRIEGPVALLSPEDADEYFHSRSRRSQIGALVSQQSRPLASRQVLEQEADACEQQYPASAGPIPRPDYWRGFVLAPASIEFWEDGAFRLHNRIVFTRAGESWTRERLYP